jgi:hypothetical protein
MANDYGCVGVVVDAKPGAVAFYAKYGFIQLDVLEGQSDARPQPTAMFRSTRAAFAISNQPMSKQSRDGRYPAK